MISISSITLYGLTYNIIRSYICTICTHILYQVYKLSYISYLPARFGKSVSARQAFAAATTKKAPLVDNANPHTEVISKMR